jgi:hypothetical protein
MIEVGSKLRMLRTARKEAAETYSRERDESRERPLPQGRDHCSIEVAVLDERFE